ncbi:MAG TPA: nitroreductase family deazaflavin-dependent oxidoreductase [Jatrophihabitans sp.]
MASRYQALVRKAGHQKWFARAGRAVVPVDRWVHHATGGRFTLLSTKVIPQLLLTTTGRRSGRARTVPLLYTEHDGGYVVVASNWGQRHHPAWSANLLANPRADLLVGGRTFPVTATLVEGADRDALWQAVTRTWPAYDTYAARSGRDLRVFLLSQTA